MRWAEQLKNRLTPVRLRIVLILLFIFFGMTPVVVQSIILSNTFTQEIIEDRTAEMQNRSLILSTKLSRSGYLRAQASERDTAIDAEIDTVASIYSGRILLVDRNYRIIRDTFHLAEGRYHVAPEIIRAFRGESTANVNEQNHYMIRSTPVYDSTIADDASGTRRVEGVILLISSTLAEREELRQTGTTQLIFGGIILILCSLLALFIAGAVMEPLHRLRTALLKVSDGDLNVSIEEDTFVETQEISSSINTALAKLRALDKSRDEFVSNVSHELKTPITSIRVLADSLMSMDEAPVELYKDFMNDISKEIDREATIIDDLLSLVKMDRAAVQLDHKATDMNAMLEQILRRLRPIARVNNIDLTLETIREVTADVDEVKFSLAITNLVENAIKYNVKDGWVHVTLDADHQFCYIRIEDSGIGIPEDQQERVFERFYRVDKARSRETGGTGLGLAITKNIIMLHQGIVRVTSKEGEGSQFLVRVPLNFIRNTTRESAAEMEKERQAQDAGGEK